MTKQDILYNDCVESGYYIASWYVPEQFGNWAEEKGMDISGLTPSEVYRKFCSRDDFYDKEWMYQCISDQFSEYLGWPDASDCVTIDSEVFPEFDGKNVWDIWDKYFGERTSYDTVYKAFDEGFDRYWKELINGQI